MKKLQGMTEITYYKKLLQRKTQITTKKLLQRMTQITLKIAKENDRNTIKQRNYYKK